MKAQPHPYLHPIPPTTAAIRSSRQGLLASWPSGVGFAAPPTTRAWATLDGWGLGGELVLGELVSVTRRTSRR
jgi:hypothetical protein